MKKKKRGPTMDRLTKKRLNRIETVLAARSSGLNAKQIAPKLKISLDGIYKDIRQGIKLRKERPGFLPRSGKQDINKKKLAKLQWFSLFAADVIGGKQTFEKAKKAPKKAFAENAKKIDSALMQNPFIFNTAICKAFNTTQPTVESHRKALVKAGKIPDITPADRLKREKRGEKARPFLSKFRITETVNALQPEFRSRAEYLFKSNKKMFSFLGMKPSDIEQKLQKKLESRLEAFNPERFRGPDRSKLERFCQMEIWLAMGHVRWSAEQKYKAALKRKTQKAAVPKPVQKPAPGLATHLNGLGSRFKLNQLETAVLLGSAAKIPMAEIGRRTDYTTERIRQVKLDLRRMPGLEKEILAIQKKLGLEQPIIKW